MFHPPQPGSVRHVLGIALPMMVSYACDTVMIFTDRLLVAKLGPVPMNAVMAGGISHYMMMGLLMGLVGYTTALAAQYLGAGQKEKCPVVTTQSLLLILAAYPVLLACRPLVHAFFGVMGVTAEQRAPQEAYFDLLLWGSVAALARHALASFFTGIGRTGIVMTASAVAMFVNVVLDYFLIFGHGGFPELGIRGAAVASIVGSAAGAAVLAGVYLAPRTEAMFAVRRSLHFSREVMAKLLRYGSPPGVEMFLNILGFNALVLLFHSTGLVGATAASIVLNWDMVSFVPLMGIEIAVTSLVGRAMGGHNPALAMRATASAIRFGLGYSAVLFVLFVFFPEMLVGVFRPAAGVDIFQEAVPLAVMMLRLASLYVFAQAMLMAWIGALRGAGDTWWAMGMTVGMHWFLVGVLYLLLSVWRQPTEAGWIALIAVFLLFTALVYARYRQGKWKSLRLVGPPPGEHEIPAAPV